jgi:uncharacterized protein YejL (UPF0352 family)
MARKASMMEEESLDIIYQEVLDVLEKHRVNQQVATTVCLAVLNVAVGSLYQLNNEQREEIADLLADNVEKTIYSYLEKIHGK